MELVDTHCHIQSAGREAGEKATREFWTKDSKLTQDVLVKNAKAAGVARLIAVGCTLEDSALAVEAAVKHPEVWAAVGIHPHEAKHFPPDNLQKIRKLLEGGSKLPSADRKVVAIGETGLDYFRGDSDKDSQKQLLRLQIELALEDGLPIIFHVREAFRDFWPIVDSYGGVKGVVHSFSSTPDDLGEVLSRGLYVGLNGIMTFTKDEGQLAAAKQVPPDKLLLETDAPFLAPASHRGKVCQPAFVRGTAEFLAGLRGESLEGLAAASTANAHKLFGV